MRAIMKIVLLFAVAQVLGILVGSGLIEAAKAIPELNEFNVSPINEPQSPLNSIIFIAYIIFGAAMFIFLAKYYKGVMLFRLLETLVIFSASFIVFFVLLLAYANREFESAFMAASALSLLLAAGKFFIEQVKNPAAVISSAGVGALFGFSIGFLPTLLFVVLLSIYDYIAVFKTRHMLLLAKEFTSRSLSFSITAKSPLPAGAKTAKVSAGGRQTQPSKPPEGERLDLGTGDIAIPIMLSVSAYSLGGYAGGMLNSIAVMAGSSIALLFLLNLVSRKKIFLPALPPLCLGGLGALLLLHIVLRIVLLFRI
jgi:presenilin-like A22 family membrane protease